MTQPVLIQFLDICPGNARVILLLHGLGADKTMWGFQLPELAAAGLRPIAVDIPGFGESAFNGSRWSLNGVGRQLLDWMSIRGWEQFDLAGLSMGGVLAQEMALAAPQRVRSLALVSTFASLRPRSTSTALYLARRFMRALFAGPEKQAHLVAEHIFPGEQKSMWRDELVRCILQADPRVYRSAMWQMAWFDSRRRLEHLRVPTLVIGGAEDQTAPVACQAELAGCIPGARQIVIQQAGHALPIDQPQEFNHALLTWLAEVGETLSTKG